MHDYSITFFFDSSGILISLVLQWIDRLGLLEWLYFKVILTILQCFLDGLHKSGSSTSELEGYLQRQA